MVISLTTNKDANKDVDVNFSITGGADQDKFTLVAKRQVGSTHAQS
ncbi:hypothetical protein BSPWISOXPB_2504 [uncultured Gammaproteobacteria bacterium]|nr:hypothetical protein BSPWISOXPB_2504 [uncultured Gammaproteobacteria bacterium]